MTRAQLPVCYSESERREEAKKRLEKRLEKRENPPNCLGFDEGVLQRSGKIGEGLKKRLEKRGNT